MGEKISFIDLFGTELELEDEYAREQLSNESAARAEDVAVLEARMDTFTTLPAGSTSGDAELMDIRVGANGVTYANAGDAVRGQAFRPPVAGKTKNIFDPTHLYEIGWNENDGVYYGIINNIHKAFNANSYPVTFEENTRYTFSYKIKTDANDSTSGNGLLVFFEYSDGTKSYSNPLIPNTTTDYVEVVLTSTANKTVSALHFTYGSSSGNIWYIKDAQLEKGITRTSFVPYLTAIDYVAKKTLDETAPDVKEYLVISENTVDFSDCSEGETYKGKMFPCEIEVGETLKVEISGDDVTTTYARVYNAAGTRLNSGSMFEGRNTRTVTLTNTYSDTIAWFEFVLANVGTQRLFTVSMWHEDNLPLRTDKLEEELETLLDGQMLVPSYFETQLATATATAKNNMETAGINGETFIFISDIHWENNSKNSPALIKRITGELPIDNVVFGGDAFNGGTQADMVALMNDARIKFTAACKRFFSVYGNHDGNKLDGGTAFTHSEFYTFMQKQSDYIMEYAEPCYYYFDNKTTKTRYIVLDTGTTTPPTASAQLTWLQNTLNNAPDGYNILVFAHVIYYPQSGGSWTDPTTWISSTFIQNVFTILDTENTEGRVKVHAVFGGHNHLDYNSQTTGGIPVVIIDCDTKQTGSSAGDASRTINEQCFDIVTVDYANKTVKCTRVGRGSDRTITY